MVIDASDFKITKYFYYMSIGENIRKYRLERRLTQVQLAEKIGTRQKVITDYETGKSKPPRDRLLVLAKFFDITVEKLVGANGQSYEEPLKIHGNKRIMKLQEIFEKLSPADQRAVIKHAAGLLSQGTQNHSNHIDDEDNNE